MILNCALEKVGNTPLARLGIQGFPGVDLYAKLEYYNPTGSVKDRAANYILQKLLRLGEIDRKTTLIESSSGNFGIALAAYCRKNGLKFIAVVDPCISPINELMIRSLGAQVVKVETSDCNGGFLLTRVAKVKELRGQIKNSYWVNQYGNPYNAEAYYNTLGTEICDGLDRIDYVFMGVSSGGTITGVSNKIKERFPNARVVAVDIIGSVIFGHPPQKRYIPGIGSSMVPDILKQARIDHVVMMDEISTIKHCHQLLEDHYIFAGGSSGSVFAAVHHYFQRHPQEAAPGVNAVAVFADRGERYINTVYNPDWYENFIRNQGHLKEM
jgi:cysteine synthase A